MIWSFKDIVVKFHDGYFIIRSLIRSYRSPEYLLWFLVCWHQACFKTFWSSTDDEIWYLISNWFIYYHTYKLLLEELDTKRLISWLRVTPVSWLTTPVSWFYHACFRDFVSRLFRGFTTPVFVTSCHAWLVYPRGLCVHACFRDFVSRLVIYPRGLCVHACYFACVSSSIENQFS